MPVRCFHRKTHEVEENNRMGFCRLVDLSYYLSAIFRIHYLLRFSPGRPSSFSGISLEISLFYPGGSFSIGPTNPDSWYDNNIAVSNFYL